MRGMRGMRGFSVLWFGQLVSELGSAMTHFAFIIWVWQTTGEATALALIAVCNAVPRVLVSLFAGSVVDRFPRKWVMIVGDLGLTLPTVIRLILLLNGDLQVWHLYLAAAVGGLFAPFQGLAFQTSVTTLVPKEQLTRANAMLSLNQYISLIAAPVLGGLLLTVAGIEAILLIDILTFFAAVIGVMLVQLPHAAPDPTHERRSIWADARFGFAYIFGRPALRGLLLVMLSFSFFETLGYPLIAPMILARTGNDEVILGTVQAVMGISGLLGGVLVTFWGGSRRKIHAILIGTMLTGLLGDALMGLGRSLPVWLVAAVFIECFIPLVMSSSQTLWQSKIPVAVQGRVFAARGLFYDIIEPIAFMSAGLLADRVFEPAMQEGGALVPIFSGLAGTGTGAGIALLVIVCGVLCALTGLLGYGVHSIRNSETILPDADTNTAPLIAR